MTSTHTFTIIARRSPSLLPRVALILSRRRLEPAALRYAVPDETDRCAIEIRLRCEARAAERLHAQLAQLVDLLDVSLDSALAALDAVPGADTPGRAPGPIPDPIPDGALAAIAAEPLAPEPAVS